MDVSFIRWVTIHNKLWLNVLMELRDDSIQSWFVHGLVVSVGPGGCLGVVLSCASGRLEIEKFSSAFDLMAKLRADLNPNRPLRREICNVHLWACYRVGKPHMAPGLNCCVPSGRWPPVCAVGWVGVLGVWWRCDQ